MYKVSFTGYRPAKLPFFGEDDPLCADLKKRIFDTVERLADSGATEFCTGMALGVDMWAAEAVLKLRESRPEITLIAMIPCRGQELKWSAAEQRRYHDILSQCNKAVCMSDVYTRDCMHRRNRALVDTCDVLIAVYDGQSGGTKYTYDYAKSLHKKIIVIPPIA